MEEQASGGNQDLAEFKAKISEEVLAKTKFVKDFPKPGVNFMDLFSITQDPVYFRKVLDAFMELGERYPDIAGEIYVVASNPGTEPRVYEQNP